MPEPASPGVIVGAVGAAVEVGALVSFNRTDGGSGVGGGILADWKNRTGARAPGAGVGASVAAAVAPGSGAASAVPSAAGPVASAAEESGTGLPNSVRPPRSRPHDWQLV